MTDCFALLDDHLATPAEPRSRLFTGYLRTLTCDDAAHFPALLAQMQAELAAGRQAVALWSYELGAAMQALPHRPIDGPPARVMLFEHCELVTAAQVDAWLLQRAAGQPAGVANISATVDEAEFTAAIDRIRDYIAAGDTYQVNYTYRLRFDAYGDAIDLYRRLRARQPVPYGALVVTEEDHAVLSFSPELFVAHAGGTLKAKPMKGTAHAADSDDVDADSINARRALALATDEKNRAENLMIVDLLRNDLGRVAEPGSVQVPHLFDVRRYGQVLQMTSTVRARLRAQVSLTETIAALYPCGSITGAPKRRTMQIIDELESTPRGLYTGAIGWFEAPHAGGHAVGDFCLSVPIRTLELQPPQPSRPGLRRGVLGVGAGIVYDSNAASEFAECSLKSAFLTGLGHEFALFETMHATREGCRHLELHLQRLRYSAATFSFPFDEASIRAQLANTCSTFASGAAYRLKLALDGQGVITTQHAPLNALALHHGSVKIFLADARTDSCELFLRHKSTRREVYDAGWKQAESRGGFDLLFFNERDELTEGGRSNVFVKIDGRWVTPPLSAGVLPGVMRAVLLADPVWSAVERTVSRAELLAAEEIVICNALRGAVQAVLA